MRGFGRSQPEPIDATRGLDDWADDLFALVTALQLPMPHLVGWSTAGAAIARYAMAHPVASLTFIGPVSPYGYGGTRADGSPCTPDFAGTGGGTANPEVVRRIAAGDASDESPFSIRNVMNAFYFAPHHREPKDREDLLVDEILLTLTGAANYPGDATASPHWPGATAYPPQPMIAQTRAVLQRYGNAHEEAFDGAGHGPHLDSADCWLEVFTAFLATTSG